MGNRPSYKKQYLKNTDPDHLELHDLHNEKPGCQIGDMNPDNAENLNITNLEAWFESNPDYDGCAHCLPRYHTK